eukprot:gene18347-28282_t
MDTTGTVDVGLISAMLREFEIEYDIESMVALSAPAKPPSPDEEGAAPQKGRLVVDFETFKDVFGHLLTHKHFRPPSFSEEPGGRDGTFPTLEATLLKSFGINDRAGEELFLRSGASNGDGVVSYEEVATYSDIAKKRTAARPARDVLHTFVAFSGSMNTTGTVDMVVLSAPAKPPSPDEEGAAPQKGRLVVDFDTFKDVFGHLLTRKHFRPPSFSE